MTTDVSVTRDVERHRLTVVAEYPASGERLWSLWADPRRLERWWGPPSHPATVTDHELREGGVVRYFMTGPDGERYHGGWRVREVEEPRRIVMEDYFADADGAPVEDMPSATMVVSIDDAGGGASRMTIEATYASAEAMEKVLAMGMEEGIRQALGQIEAVLSG